MVPNSPRRGGKGGGGKSGGEEEGGRGGRGKKGREESFIALFTPYTWKAIPAFARLSFPWEGSQNFEVCVSVLSSPESELEINPEKHRKKPFTIDVK